MRLSRRQYASKLADDVRRFFAHVQKNWLLKQRIMARRADDEAVVTDSSNIACILANYYASINRTDEGRDHPSLPET